jgi:transposase
VLRTYMRQREKLVVGASTCIQHMQKALTEMNIQLANVISDISGMTGMAILRAIVSGERNPLVLARLKNERIQASLQEIAQSLEGNWRPELLLVLEQIHVPRFPADLAAAGNNLAAPGSPRRPYHGLGARRLENVAE